LCVWQIFCAWHLCHTMCHMSQMCILFKFVIRVWNMSHYILCVANILCDKYLVCDKYFVCDNYFVCDKYLCVTSILCVTFMSHYDYRFKMYIFVWHKIFCHAGVLMHRFQKKRGGGNPPANQTFELFFRRPPHDNHVSTFDRLDMWLSDIR